MTDAHFSVVARPPDLIMAELWEIKRQLNQEAGYRLEELTCMAKNLPTRFGINGIRLA